MLFARKKQFEGVKENLERVLAIGIAEYPELRVARLTYFKVEDILRLETAITKKRGLLKPGCRVISIRTHDIRNPYYTKGAVFVLDHSYSGLGQEIASSLMQETGAGYRAFEFRVDCTQ